MYTENLIDKYKQNKLYNKVIVLRGGIGLGQKDTVHYFSQALQNDGFEIFDVSQIVSSLSMFQIWESVYNLMNTDIKDLYQKGFSYSEFIISQIIKKCKTGTRILFICKDMKKCELQTLQFIEQLFEFVLSEYKTIFIGCYYTDSEFINNIDEILSNLITRTYYINYKAWEHEELKKYMYNIFDKPLKIEKEQTKLILDTCFGNPSKLLEIINYLKSENIIMEETNQYICKSFSKSIISQQIHTYIDKQFKKLNLHEKQILKGSSLLGVEFDSDLLIRPLNFLFVEQNLKKIEKFTQLLHQKNDTIYEFYNESICSAIKNFVSSEEYKLWNQLLAEFYYKRAESQQNKGNYIHACENFLQSANYYIENRSYETSVMIYRNIISLLLSFMQYQEALNVIEKIRFLCKTYNINLEFFLYYELILLEAQCSYIVGDFIKSTNAYEEFLTLTVIKEEDIYLYKCQYAMALYSCGETERPYDILKGLYKTIINQKVSQNNVKLHIEILSALSSVEETIDNSDFIEHFNKALDLAHKFKLADTYNILLRKSFIVHKGINGIQLLETAKKYFQETNNRKEYAMSLHNIASLYLLTNNLDIAARYCDEAVNIFKEYGCDRIYYTYNCYGMFWLLQCKYKKAIEYFDYAYKEKLEPFSKIVIACNQVTAYRKLKYFKKAESILKQVNQLWRQDEINTYKILWPNYLLTQALLYQDMGNNVKAYNLYIEYLEYEFDNSSYKVLLAVRNLKEICLNLNRSFPSKFEHMLQYKDSTYLVLKEHNLVLNHLMFAE